jgi:F-type H+-transporting ATPase subunit b
VFALIDLSNVLLAAAEDHAAPNPLAFSVDLALFTLAIFVGMLLILTKFAWRPILDGLSARERRVADDIDAAKAANEQAQASLKQVEQRLAAVAQEANDIVSQAKKEALAMKERIVAEAGEEAQRQRDRAVADIRAAKDAAVRELAQKSAESAVQLAGSIVGRSLQSGDHQRLIDESIDRFVKNN